MSRKTRNISSKEVKNIVDSIDDFIVKDEDFVDEYLKEHGYSLASVESETTEFVRDLIESKKAENIRRRTRQWRHESVRLLMEEHTSKDPIEVIKEKSRELVLDAFTKGWSGPPFDVVALAKLNGLMIMPSESVPDARIIPLENEEFKVEYNPFQSPARINFSIAHEIGHTFFSDCSNTVRNRERELENDSWELEFLCNIAAAELLLPYASFSNEANEIRLDMDSLLNLARKYRASAESVFLRFSEVVDKPCAVAIASYNQEGELHLDYSKNSSRSELKLLKGMPVPGDSKLYDCTKPGDTAHAVEKWVEFGDTKYRVFGVGLSPVKKQLAPRVGIFLVPEKFDEFPPNAIYMVNGDATKPRGEGVKVIVQIVNTAGVVGRGFGAAMAKKFPESKKSIQEWKKKKEDFFLGNSKLVKLSDQLFVYQIIAHKGLKPKYGKVPLQYDSLREGLISLRKRAIELNATVHMPLIGAGQAGGNWNVIKGMIYDELVCHQIESTIYVLPGTKIGSAQSKTLTIFKEDEK